MTGSMRGSGPGGGGPGGGVQTWKAVLLIAVLVAIGAIVLNQTGKSSPAASSSSSHRTTTTTTTTTHTVPPATTTPTTLVPASHVKVQVLNGASANLPIAGQWTNKLKTSYGYETALADNATSLVTKSVIYVVTPGYQPEADALALTIGLTPASVNPAAPPPATAPIPASQRNSGANLVLVVGPDLASKA